MGKYAFWMASFQCLAKSLELSQLSAQTWCLNILGY